MNETVKFLQDGKCHELVNPDPTETVLNYLRYTLELTGTKEGCAEGDCGACTVVLGELVNGTVRYRAVNACILFLPVLDGKELITVESLKSSNGTLHPVQQALVDTHGSQCGFCTPGFVMSLYALYMEGTDADTPAINDTLAGNLCRCTGYGPIIKAAQDMQEQRVPVTPEILTEKINALRSIQRTDTLALTAKSALTGNDKRYYAPSNLEGLVAVAEENPEAVFLAGGTDVGLWVTKMHKELTCTIYVGNVPELKEINTTLGTIEIGAGVAFTDAMESLSPYYPDMAELIRRIGSVQIRNSGTIGGNIANGSPIGDSMPALIAAGADLVLRKESLQRTIPLEDYFIDYGKQDRTPGEFVEKIIIPKPAANFTFRAYKLSKRFDQDISAVCGCFGLTIVDDTVQDARICYGGMAATPKRAKQTEAALIGKIWSLATIESAMQNMAQDYAPISDMRASADYRLTAAKNLLMKLYAETTTQASTRLVGKPEAVHA